MDGGALSHGLTAQRKPLNRDKQWRRCRGDGGRGREGKWEERRGAGEEGVRGASWADHGTASRRVYCSHIPFTAAVAVEEEKLGPELEPGTRRRSGDQRENRGLGEKWGPKRRTRDQEEKWGPGGGVGTGWRSGDQEEKQKPGGEPGTRRRTGDHEEKWGPDGEVGTWFLTRQ